MEQVLTWRHNSIAFDCKHLCPAIEHGVHPFLDCIHDQYPASDKKTFRRVKPRLLASLQFSLSYGLSPQIWLMSKLSSLCLNRNLWVSCYIWSLESEALKPCSVLVMSRVLLTSINKLLQAIERNPIVPILLTVSTAEDRWTAEAGMAVSGTGCDGLCCASVTDVTAPTLTRQHPMLRLRRSQILRRIH